MAMMHRLFPALSLFFVFSAAAEERPVEPAEFNQRISEATAAGEAWAKDPANIAATLVGPWLSPGEEMASMRREISASTQGENQSTGVIVIVKEDGLLDDATRRIDHRFAFDLVDGTWTITDASVKFHDARPPYPLREEENTEKAVAGRLLLQRDPSTALKASAAANGIQDLAATTFGALEGDPNSLNAILNLSLAVSEEARADYAYLVYGLGCFFERAGFTRYLFFNLQGGASTAVLDLIEKIEDGEL